MSLVSKALARATGQFQSSPKLMALIAAIVGQLDDAVADANSLKTERWIDTAIGKQLDGCGYIVGELRKGRQDEEYRQAIRFRVFVNTSQGTPNALIRGLAYLINSDDKQYLEMYPVTSILFADCPTVPVDIQAQIQDLAPAGFSTVPVCVSYTEKPFRFSKPISNPKLRLQSGDFITANGLKIRVASIVDSQIGANFGGIAHPCLSANGARLKIGGSKLRIHSPNNDIVFGSDYNLTGVFQ